MTERAARGPHGEAAAMRSRNCVVTGATSGIGRAVALELGRMGARVAVVGRDEARGRRVARRIGSGPGGGSALFLRCDLSSQRQVRALAAVIRREMPVIDVLVNNAGAKFDTFQLSEDGIEMTFATNHLSHFLLTGMLMDSLLQAPAARIVVVAGESHRAAHGDFRRCLSRERYDRRLAAQQAKLANLMFTYDLAERLAGSTITANAVHPGGVATRIGRNNGMLSWIRHIGAHLYHQNLITARKAAETVVWLAISSQVEGVSGGYFYRRSQIDSSPLSKSREPRERLWDLSESLKGFGAELFAETSGRRHHSGLPVVLTGSAR